ncbi:MAG TPA: 8-amino-7-oxononanoate synthase [Elusimicrobiota bacterium]|nr:8-amino-7-oxononanoate synthase [Elusimicrobiota bacterium]
MNIFSADIETLKQQDLYRRLRVVGSAATAHVSVEGRDLINFASNDYLAMSSDPRLKKAAAEAVARWGAGATASRLLGGTLSLHEQLERRLADLKRTAACLVFPSGYHVNTGVLPVLADAGDVLFLDRYSHASLVDGARLSKAELRVFKHNDPSDLGRCLKRAGRYRRRWIVTESVFSMDGDRAPLREIGSLAARYGASVYVDEAHATGVWGGEGEGLVPSAGMNPESTVVMGTMSKALGGLGGFLCGSEGLKDWVVNRCRSFIYSTALSPVLVATALTALEIVTQDPERRERLFSLSDRLRHGLRGAGYEVMGDQGPIVPLLLGAERTALRFSEQLFERDVWAPAVRFPTVPKGHSRIRFSVSAGHTDADIDRVLDLLNSKRFHGETD